MPLFVCKQLQLPFDNNYTLGFDSITNFMRKENFETRQILRLLLCVKLFSEYEYDYNIQ